MRVDQILIGMLAQTADPATSQRAGKAGFVRHHARIANRDAVEVFVLLELAFLKIARRQRAERLCQVDGGGRAEIAERLAAGVLTHDGPHAPDGLHKRLAVGNLHATRPAHGDRLEILCPHHRADPAATGGAVFIVHNAGTSSDATFPGMEVEQWENVINTNLNSFYYVCKPLIMPMLRKRWGRIVSISSVAALHGNRGQTNYAASKGGVIAMTKSFAIEAATSGIRYNSITPGFIATEMTEGLSDELKDSINAKIPMKRMGRE